MIAPGTKLGSYEVLSSLGAGGMGEVYRARDIRLNRDVALKVLLPAVANDGDRLARFSREAQLLASLNHPHIAQIHGLEEAGGVRALVMELVDGPTLADRIAAGPVPLTEALMIASQIAEALETAHEQGIIHRDLKPTNIKVRPDGTVKVLDFGLAKAVETPNAPRASDAMSPTLSLHATEAGLILGTAAYMSPEQAAGKPVDQRSDIWAFGVVVLEMLTGQRPFAGDTAAETMAAVIMKEPDWTTLPPDMPPPIRRLLRRCLEKDRKRRLPDAATARLEIEEALNALADAPVKPVALRPGSRWRGLAMVGGALVAGGAIVAGAMLVLQRFTAAPLVTRLEVSTPPAAAPFQFMFALSPDGRRLAFLAGNPRMLWVRALDQVNAQALGGTNDAQSPFWSPDSRSLGFFADGKLKRVDLAGGAQQVLADAVGVSAGGTWSAEGTIVYGGPLGLIRVPATGGTPVQVTHPPAGQADGTPQFLPDGRLLFFRAGLGFQQAQGGTVSIVAVDGGEPIPVVSSARGALYAPPGYLLRVSQGVLMAQRFDAARASLSGDPVAVAQDVAEAAGRYRSAFSVSVAGVLAHRGGEGAGQRQLTWLDRSGKLLGTVGPRDENAPTSFAIAPDGRRVANARSVQGNYDVWLTEVSRSVVTRFTFDSATPEFSPVWSPDGTRIVYRVVNRSSAGSSDLFVKPSNGASNEQPLLVSPQPKTPLDWSRDGRFLLFSASDPKTQSDLWVLPLGADEGKPFPVLQTAFSETQGQFSPDGRWIAYTSNESGRDEVYMRPFPDSGGKVHVSTNGGSQPRWRPDGRELFYIAPDAKLMAVPLTVAAKERTVTVGAGQALFETRLAEGPAISLAGFQSRALYEATADGRFLMNMMVGENQPRPITIVQNWEAVLKR